MNYSTYRFTLDIHKARSQVSIPVMYQDTWVRFYINLTDGGKPYALDGVDTAVLFGKKSDGSPLSKECVISADKTRIEYTFNEQTASVIGSVACEIRLYSKSGLHLTTPSFVILVEERVVEDEDLVESVPDLSAIDSIFMSEAAREEAENARKVSEEGRAEAETERKEAETKRQELSSLVEENLERVSDLLVEIDEELYTTKRTANIFDISKVRLDEADSVDYTTGKITARVEGDSGGARQAVALGVMKELIPEMEVGKTYTISWQDNFGGSVICYCGMHEGVPATESGHSFVATEETLNSHLVFTFWPYYTDVYVDIWDIMINEGDEELPYEPYYKKESVKQSVEDLKAVVGDVSTALDNLHTYAQALVNGGATV